MRVLIAGSTGMIGGLILLSCIESISIKEIITLVRKPTLTAQNKKVNEVVVSDFDNYVNNTSIFKNIDIAFFCIGVYTGKVDDKQFKKITVDYAVAFCEKLEQESPKATVCLLSGAGADRTERSKTAFARFKGMAENRISKMDLNFYTFRPAYIYPVTPRKEPNLLYSLTRFLYPVLKILFKNSSIESTRLAKAMLDVGLYGAEKEILENKDIIKIT